MPVVIKDQCTGCGLCVEACGPRSLAMTDGLAVLAFPDTCVSEEHCISVCRDDAIRMAWLPFSGDETVGRWRTDGTRAVPGEA
jgi:NAD-dependent dihydropyrimidine dehydrogenase PreA subunit